jgi:hypothetical protein
MNEPKVEDVRADVAVLVDLWDQVRCSDVDEVASGERDEEAQPSRTISRWLHQQATTIVTATPRANSPPVRTLNGKPSVTTNRGAQRLPKR